MNRNVEENAPPPLTTTQPKLKKVTKASEKKANRSMKTFQKKQIRKGVSDLQAEKSRLSQECKEEISKIITLSTQEYFQSLHTLKNNFKIQKNCQETELADSFQYSHEQLLQCQNIFVEEGSLDAQKSLPNECQRLIFYKFYLAKKYFENEDLETVKSDTLFQMLAGTFYTFEPKNMKLIADEILFRNPRISELRALSGVIDIMETMEIESSEKTASLLQSASEKLEKAKMEGFLSDDLLEAQIILLMGNKEEMEQFLNQNQDSFESTERLNYLKAALLHKNGEKKKAIEIVKNIVKTNSKFTRAQQTLNKYKKDPQAKEIFNLNTNINVDLSGVVDFGDE